MNAILTRVLGAHWLMSINDNPFLRDTTPWRARCACRAPIDGQTTHGAAVDAWIAHVVGLVAAETQAELARQFADSGSMVSNERATLTYNAGQSPALLPGREGR